MCQYEAVERIMEENGGYATLKLLYEDALHVDGTGDIRSGELTPNRVESIADVLHWSTITSFYLRRGIDLWHLTSTR